MPKDFEAWVGHKFQFRAKPKGNSCGFVECEVLEVVAPLRLADTWLGDADWQAPTIVRWTTEPIEGGKRLRLEHTNLQEPWGRKLQAMLSQGWKKMLAETIVRVMGRLESEAQSLRGLCLPQRRASGDAVNQDGENKMKTQNVNKGTRGFAVTARKYEPIRKAILACVPRNKEGLSF
jgi:hypothetical protein